MRGATLPVVVVVSGGFAAEVVAHLGHIDAARPGSVSVAGIVDDHAASPPEAISVFRA